VQAAKLFSCMGARVPASPSWPARRWC